MKQHPFLIHNLLGCCFCGYHDETASHLVLQCWWPIAFLNLLGIHVPSHHENANNIGDWLWLCFMNFSDMALALICYGTLMI